MWMITCLFLLAGLSFSPFQDSTATAPEQSSAEIASKKSADLPPAVASTQPVITIRGLCDKDSAGATPKQNTCTRSVTRKEFEVLMNTLNPEGRAVPANARRNLARTYTEYVAIEAAMQHAGMENEPELRQLLEWTRLRAIADFYRHTLQEKYSNPAAADIEAYYHQHQADYERVKLARILVPRESASNKSSEFDQKALQVAKAAQARAVQGDDPAKVQQDAYNTLGLVEPLPVDLGARRRSDMVPEEARDVFSLNPGQVTQVKTEPGNYVIYKVINKDMVPLQEVKTEIARAIYQQKFREAMKTVIDAVPAEFNQEYFGAETEPPKPQVAPGPSPLR